MLEACRSVVAATLFYGTDLYHYVYKANGKYNGQIKVRGITTYTPLVASAELAAALVTTALEAHDRCPSKRSTHARTRRPRAGVPQARRRRGPREAGVPRPELGPERARRARPHHQGHGLRQSTNSTHRLSRRSSPRSARPSRPARRARRSSTSASRRTRAARVRSSDSRRSTKSRPLIV